LFIFLKIVLDNLTQTLIIDSMKQRQHDLSETQIVHRQHIIAEAVENDLFIHYIKGYLGGYSSQLLFEMAEAFLGRNEAPFGENYVSSKETK